MPWTGWTRRLSRKRSLFISHLHFSPSNSANSALRARWPSCCSGHGAERGHYCIRFQPCAQRLLFLGSNSKVPGKASDFLSLYPVPALQPSIASREGPFTSMVNSSVTMLTAGGRDVPRGKGIVLTLCNCGSASGL